MSKARYCPQCGSENKPQAKFCTSCGVTFSTDTPTSASQEGFKPPAPDPADKPAAPASSPKGGTPASGSVGTSPMSSPVTPPLSSDRGVRPPMVESDRNSKRTIWIVGAVGGVCALAIVLLSLSALSGGETSTQTGARHSKDPFASDNAAPSPSDASSEARSSGSSEPPLNDAIRTPEPKENGSTADAAQGVNGSDSSSADLQALEERANRLSLEREQETAALHQKAQESLQRMRAQAASSSEPAVVSESAASQSSVASAEPASSRSNSDFQSLVRSAREHYESGAYAQAIELAQKGLEDVPKHAELTWLLTQSKKKQASQ